MRRIFLVLTTILLIFCTGVLIDLIEHPVSILELYLTGFSWTMIAILAIALMDEDTC